MIYEAEAEEVILGTMFGPWATRDHVAQCLDGLRPELFFDPKNRLVYATIKDLFIAGKDVSHPLAVLSQLRRDGNEESAGGSSHLHALMHTAATTRTAIEHIPILERAHQIRLWQKLTGEATVTDDDLERVAAMAQMMVSSAKPSPPPRHISAVMTDFMAKIEDKEPQMRSFPTPFPLLTEKLGGLVPKRLVVIGGKTGEGKTSLALQIAAHAVERGARTLFISLEMTEPELAQKLIAMRAQIPTFRVLEPLDWQKLIDIERDAQMQPLVIDDAREADINRLRQRVDIASGMLGGLDIVVVDYLQLVTSGRKENRNLEVDEVVRSLKNMAGQRDCCVIALSQLSRLHEQQGVKPRRPKLSDLRESGAIEHAADQVLLLYQLPDSPYADTLETEVSIAKNRHGPRCVVKTDFIASQSRFEQR